MVKQEILIERPPIYDQIVAVFPEATSYGVIFSWGDKIYNPSDGPIPPPILAHEAIHGDRQLKPPQGLEVDSPAQKDNWVQMWWEMYLFDPKFRLDEEVPAHIEEYKVYKQLVKDREQRARYLHRLALRLAGPLYNNMLPYMAARRLLQGEVTKL